MCECMCECMCTCISSSLLNAAMVVKSMTPQLQQTQETQSIGGKEASPVKYVEDITNAPIAVMHSCHIHGCVLNKFLAG